MESERPLHRKLERREDYFDWKSHLANFDGVPEELVNLMDSIISIISKEEAELKSEHLMQVQKEGDEIYGMDVASKQSNGKLKVRAYIELAKENGVITENEYRDLYFKIGSKLM